MVKNIAVIGLGYVGLVGSACLAKMGYNVIGMDIDSSKVDMLKKGKLPIYEEGLDELFQEVKSKLEFTTSIDEAVKKSDLCFVCVGTPSKKDGSVDLTYVEQAAKEIGESLKSLDKYYYVVYRSTIPPTTSQELIIPTLEKYSNKKYQKDFGYAFNPEFLREGSAIYDFFNPPKTVIGTTDEKTAQELLEIYKSMPNEKIVIPFVEAEMVKYVDNIWHAIKVDFANEIGYAAKQFGADGRLVMDVFCKDRKLNISPTYLKPGFAFGGSCLPKDVKGLLSLIKKKNIEEPLLESVLPSNYSHIKKAKHLIEEHAEGKEVVILGVAFKPGTDDVRESPAIYLAKELLDSGFKVYYFDPLVNAEKVRKTFGDFIDIKDEDFISLENAINKKNLVFTGSFTNLPKDTSLYKNKNIFDLNGVFYDIPEIRSLETYYALCW